MGKGAGQAQVGSFVNRSGTAANSNRYVFANYVTRLNTLIFPFLEKYKNLPPSTPEPAATFLLPSDIQTAADI